MMPLARVGFFIFPPFIKDSRSTPVKHLQLEQRYVMAVITSSITLVTVAMMTNCQKSVD
jgi:hypothetical protein